MSSDAPDEAFTNMRLAAVKEDSKRFAQVFCRPWPSKHENISVALAVESALPGRAAGVKSSQKFAFIRYTPRQAMQ